jgi:hypothetical protein
VPFGFLTCLCLVFYAPPLFFLPFSLLTSPFFELASRRIGWVGTRLLFQRCSTHQTFRSWNFLQFSFGLENIWYWGKLCNVHMYFSSIVKEVIYSGLLYISLFLSYYIYYCICLVFSHAPLPFRSPILPHFCRSRLPVCIYQSKWDNNIWKIGKNVSKNFAEQICLIANMLSSFQHVS